MGWTEVLVNQYLWENTEITAYKKPKKSLLYKENWAKKANWGGVGSGRGRGRWTYSEGHWLTYLVLTRDLHLLYLRLTLPLVYATAIPLLARLVWPWPTCDWAKEPDFQLIFVFEQNRIKLSFERSNQYTHLFSALKPQGQLEKSCPLQTTKLLTHSQWTYATQHTSTQT